MKLILKPFKFIFKLVLWVVAILLIITTVLLALMYKPVIPPELNNNNNYEEKLTESIDILVDKNNDDRRFTFGFDTNSMNIEIRKALIAQLNLDDSNNTYIYEEGAVKIQSVWVNYKGQKIEITAGIHIDLNFITYKTRVLIALEIEQNNDEIVLKIDKISLGNLPVKWLVNLGATFSIFDRDDLENSINDEIEGYGVFNYNNKTFRINVNSIISNELDSSDQLIKIISQVIFENKLFELKINDNNNLHELEATIDLKKIENNKEAFVVLENEKLKTEEEFNLFIRQKAIESIISGTKQIRFDELDINRVIEYLFLISNGNSELYQMIILNQYNLYIGSPYMLIDDNKTMLNLPIRFGKENDYFKTTLELNVDLLISGDDLIFDIKEAKLGQIDLDKNKIAVLLGSFSTEELEFKDNKYIIKDFLKDFNQESISFKEIKIIDNLIAFEYEFLGSYTQLNELITNLSDVSIPENIQNKVKEIVENIIDEKPFFENIAEVVLLVDLIPNKEEIFGDNIELIEEVVGNIIGELKDQTANPILEAAATNIIEKVKNNQPVFDDITNIVSIIDMLPNKSEIYDILESILKDYLM